MFIFNDKGREWSNKHIHILWYIVQPTKRYVRVICTDMTYSKVKKMLIKCKVRLYFVK